MKFDQAMQELREEAITEGALEATLAKVRSGPNPSNQTLRRGLIFAVGVTAVAGFAIYPWRKADQLWAQAKSQLVDAKILHINIKGRTKEFDGEVWIHGDKVCEASRHGDIRINGKMLTQKTGQVASFKPLTKSDGYFLRGYTNFKIAVQKIGDGTTTPKLEVVNGKRYSTYRFATSSISFEEGVKRKAIPMVRIFLTAFVDPETNRIVRLKEDAEETPELAIYKKNHKFDLQGGWYDNFRMDAWIDYPETIDENRFDPPANAFDQKESYNVFEKALHSTVGEAIVANQKVKVHGVFFDGKYVNVIWSGTAANFMSKDRFTIEGVSLGEIQDIRCFSSGKIAKPGTANIPFCQQGSEVLTTMPKTVNLTLPVFANDLSQPYPGLAKGKGYKTKKVGEAKFRDVPVIPSLWLQNYQRLFGLSKDWW